MSLIPSPHPNPLGRVTCTIQFRILPRYMYRYMHLHTRHMLKSDNWRIVSVLWICIVWRNITLCFVMLSFAAFTEPLCEGGRASGVRMLYTSIPRTSECAVVPRPGGNSQFARLSDHIRWRCVYTDHCRSVPWRYGQLHLYRHCERG